MGTAGAKSEKKIEHDRGLLLIGLFKLGKALFFFAIGVGAIRFLHKDLGEEVQRLATAWHFDTEHRIVDFLMDKVDVITPHRLKQIGIGTFAYSALALTEGIGLMREKVWAEYLTLSLTTLLLPWELYELVRRADMFRVSILLTNIAVLAYLLWLLEKKREERRDTAKEKG